MIAVVALLISLLLPALERARAMARMVACASNIRSGMLALNTYSIDNEGYFPYFTHINTNYRNQWAYNISPYLGRQGRASITDGISYEGDAYGLHYLRCPEHHYLNNHSIGGHFAWSTVPTPWDLGQSRRIDEIPDMFIISDANNGNFTSPKYYPYLTHWGPASVEKFHWNPEWRHMDMHNFAYLDGRVEQFSRQWFLDHPQKLPSDF